MKQLSLKNLIALFLIILSNSCLDNINAASSLSKKTKNLTPSKTEKLTKTIQPSEKLLPPVGFINKGEDCYFSTAMQLMLNHPAFIQAALNAGKKQPLYREVVEEYQKAQKENKIIDTHNSSAYRKLKNYLNEKTGGLFPDNEQQDAGRALKEIIMDIARFQVTTPFEMAFKIPTTKETGVNKFFNYGGFDGKRLEKFGDFGEAILDSLEGFRPESKYLGLSDDLLIFGDMEPSKRLFSFSFPRELFVTPPNETAVYYLNYFALYIGDGDFGHYIAWLKVNGIWYEANDSSITSIGNDNSFRNKFNALLTSGPSIIRMIALSYGKM